MESKFEIVDQKEASRIKTDDAKPVKENKNAKKYTGFCLTEGAK